MNARATPATTGFAGVLPDRSGLVAHGVDDGVLQRWDRWFELVAARGLPSALDPRRSAWRFAIRGGVFGPEPLAGAMRLSRDASGRVYPFAVMRTGLPPEPTDPWYDGAERVVLAATEPGATLTAIRRAVGRLPEPRSLTAPDATARLWRDDWEAEEVVCPDASSLVGFPARSLAEVRIEGAEPWA